MTLVYETMTPTPLTRVIAVLWLASVLGVSLAIELAVCLNSASDIGQFAREHGLRHLAEIKGLPGCHTFELLPEYDATVHLHPSRSVEVEWWEEQTMRRLVKRDHVITTTLPVDPEYPRQWHLGADFLNVPAAWSRGYSGKGVLVAVLDDGAQPEHPDLTAAFRRDLSFDINRNCSCTELEEGDDHGTPSAALILGRSNAVCGVGVAPGADLVSVRLLGALTNDAQEAQAIATGAPLVDVYSASWGPPDDGRRLEGPGWLSSTVLRASVLGNPLYPQLLGRGGLGTIYVWASGNGGLWADNCNYDGWVSSRLTIAVSAVGDDGRPPKYAERCSALITSAPSSGGELGITTADLLGSDGKEPGDCRHNFGGTSAAGPMVAGVVALMLEANPRLSWLDVQRILIQASRPLPADPGTRNGAGLLYSHWFGFGILDAEAAVKLAETYEPTTASVVGLEFSSAEVSLPLNPSRTIESSIDVPDDLTVEHAEVVPLIYQRHRGDLAILLESPSGTISVLTEPHKDKNADFVDWTLTSTVNWGERSRGLWTLIVLNSGPSTGTLTRWSLKLWLVNKTSTL